MKGHILCRLFLNVGLCDAPWDRQAMAFLAVDLVGDVGSFSERLFSGSVRLGESCLCDG